MNRKPLFITCIAIAPLVLLSEGMPASANFTERAIAVGGGVPIAQTIPASTKIIYVNPVTGNDTGAGDTEAAPYRTITYALTQATAGTIVQLQPGSYTPQTGETFPLAIKKGVSLRGDVDTVGQRTAIIGGGSYNSPTFAEQNVTILAGQDSEISGMTIANPNRRGSAVWIESTNAKINNNTFTNSDREGVFITGTANPKIENNVFTRNAGNGISVARTATGEIRNNLLQDTGTGIAIGQTASPLITGNRILQNQDGIIVSDDATPTLRSNTIENNKRDGVVATSNAQPNLGTAEAPGQNRIRNNARYDLSNITRSNTIVAVGNDIDQQRISGRVDFVATTIPGGKFADVQGYWAQAYIEALASQVILTGFPDGTFRPGEPVTRAQFAAIINKAFSPRSERAGIEFTDVKSNFWAYNAIQSAYRGNFVSGYPGQVYRPDRRIPRLEVLVSLSSGLKLRSQDTGVLAVYSDRSSIPDWAASAIAGATQRNLVVNYPTLKLFNPNRDATRAEVAAFVYQALVDAGRVPAIPSPYLVTQP